MRALLALTLLAGASAAHAWEPACWPTNVNKVAIIPAPTIGGTALYATWTCAKPDGSGYTNAVFSFDAMELQQFVPKYMTSTLTTTDMRNAWLSQGSELPADQLQRATVAVQAYLTTAVVANNGTVPVRSVYRISPLTGKLVMVIGPRVATGKRCWVNRRIPGTDYYSVQYVDDASTPADDQLGDVYALCTLLAPKGVMN